jgi:hypothetical protein
MQKKNKTFIFKILSFFLSIFLVFLSLEIYVRKIVDDGLNLDIEMLKYANSLKIISKNEAVGIEHKKNIEKKLMNVNIKLNSQGFRNNIDIDIEKKKILMLGDSMTLGWGSIETFSTHLEKNINQDIQVLNAGIGNTNTYMQINNFFTNFVKYDFDVIILNFFINDFENVKIKNVNFIKKNFYSYTYIENMMYKILIKLSLIDNWENFYKKTFENEKFVQKSLNEIIKLNNYCNKNNILLIINNIPELRNLINYKFSLETQIIKNFSKENNIMFIDSYDILKNHAEETLWVSNEDSHANDKAHLLISKFLEEKLEDKIN